MCSVYISFLFSSIQHGILGYKWIFHKILTQYLDRGIYVLFGSQCACTCQWSFSRPIYTLHSHSKIRLD